MGLGGGGVALDNERRRNSYYFMGLSDEFSFEDCWQPRVYGEPTNASVAEMNLTSNFV